MQYEEVMACSDNRGSVSLFQMTFQAGMGLPLHSHTRAHDLNTTLSR